MEYTFREQSVLDFYKKHRDLSHIEEIKLVYGLRLFMLDLKKFIVIYSLAFLLGVAFELLLVQVGFLIFRQVAYGLHANGFWTCLLSSGIAFLGGTYFFHQIQLTEGFLYTLFFFCVVMLSLLAPISSQKIKVRDSKHRNKLRKRMYFRFLLLFVLIIALPLSVSIFLVYGMLIETSIIGYSYIILKRGKLECQSF